MSDILPQGSLKWNFWATDGIIFAFKNIFRFLILADNFDEFTCILNNSVLTCLNCNCFVVVVGSNIVNTC